MSLAAEQQLFEDCLAATDALAREKLLSDHPDSALAARVRRLLDAVGPGGGRS